MAFSVARPVSVASVLLAVVVLCIQGQQAHNTVDSATIQTQIEYRLKYGLFPTESELQRMGFLKQEGGFTLNTDDGMLVYGRVPPNHNFLAFTPKNKVQVSEALLGAVLAHKEFEVSMPASIKVVVSRGEERTKQGRVVWKDVIHVGFDGKLWGSMTETSTY